MACYGYNLLIVHIAKAYNPSYSRTTCLLALQILTQVEWSMGPPMKVSRCELDVSDNNDVISDVFVFVNAKWNIVYNISFITIL